MLKAMVAMNEAGVIRLTLIGLKTDRAGDLPRTLREMGWDFDHWHRFELAEGQEAVTWTMHQPAGYDWREQVEQILVTHDALADHGVVEISLCPRLAILRRQYAANPRPPRRPPIDRH
jgi:hypothetical protein